VLKKAGRQRGIEAEVARLHVALRSSQMRQLPLVEDAMGHQALTLLRKLDAACTGADELAEAAVEAFEAHPDAEIITSFPGLGSLTGARVLAEIGDDRSRFADARALKSDAGAAPVTRASGKSVSVKARRVKNQRLAAAGYVWTFASLTASKGRQSPLRPQTRQRRTAHRSPAQSVQSHDRVLAPLPR
jgi:transposase